MLKSISHKSIWLVGLVLIIIAALLISGGCKINELPVISDLAVTSQGEINPGVTAQITCTAVDPDEDELTYTWTADGGTMSGSGNHIYWQAPEALGTYTIYVEVSDGDDIVTDQLTLTVLAPNNFPVMEPLSTDCPRVKPAKSGVITCVASDPDKDELTYTWTAERGNITGSGDEVTWTAPSEYGTYVISVIVTDGRGGEVTGSINIIVCTCGSACG